MGSRGAPKLGNVPAKMPMMLGIKVVSFTFAV